MAIFRKKLDDFRNNMLEKPLKAFWTVFGSYFCILIIISFRSNLLALISSDLIYFFLDSIFFTLIYAFYSFYFVPFVLHLPDGTQDFSSFLKSMKLTRIGFSLKCFCLSLVIGILLLIGYFSTDIILGELFIYKLDFNQVLQPPSLTNRSYFNFIYHIIPAFWEEIIFRGIMLTILLKKFSVRTAIIIDGVFFGISHMANHSNIFIGLGQGIYTFCSGIILGYLYVKTSNLIPSMIAHYVNNIISALLSIGEVNLLVFLLQQCLISSIVLILGVGIIRLYEYKTNHHFSKD